MHAQKQKRFTNLLAVTVGVAILLIFSATIGLFLQGLLETSGYYTTRLFQGKPLPMLLAVYREQLSEDSLPLFQICIVPSLLIGIYAFLSIGRDIDMKRLWSRLCFLSVCCLMLTLAFMSFSIYVMMLPFVPWIGMMQMEDYQPPIFASGLNILFFICALLIVIAFLYAATFHFRTTKREKENA